MVYSEQQIRQLFNSVNSLEKTLRLVGQQAKELYGGEAIEDIVNSTLNTNDRWLDEK